MSSRPRATRATPRVRAFIDWLEEQAAASRAVTGDS